ncbi:MAG TPA: threonine synthase, partial [Ilumatobacter sp.]
MSAKPVVATASPSRDIQVSSNFERLLFEINGRDGGLTGEQLQRFRLRDQLDLEADQRAEWIEGSFRGASADDDATIAEIARIHRETGLLIDPHTATATAAARSLDGPHPIVTLATAHPAQFPDAVERATGVRPHLPAHLADLLERTERTVTIPAGLADVERFVESVGRR